jgi:hypothetical protein
MRNITSPEELLQSVTQNPDLKEQITGELELAYGHRIDLVPFLQDSQHMQCDTIIRIVSGCVHNSALLQG